MFSAVCWKQKGKKLVGKGIITLVNDAAGYVKENIKSINLKTIEKEYCPNITKITCRCFIGCTALEEIITPESVTEIGAECFSGCRSLTNITLSSNLKKMGNSCFHGCTKLQFVNVIESDGKTKQVRVKSVTSMLQDIMAIL